MSTITWLHISDLHWRKQHRYDANIVAAALLRDLEQRSEIAPQLARIDLIFVTGDLAYAGCSEEYDLAERFLQDLLKITGVPNKHLFVVPGNHDVNWGYISEDAGRIVDGLKTRHDVNELLQDGTRRAQVMARFGDYRRFVNRYLDRATYFDSQHYYYVTQCKVGSKRLAILGLNSAWASPSGRDRRQLFLGECQVRAAAEDPTARNADLCIALLHHPLEWLEADDRYRCSKVLFSTCQFVLHGHQHQTEITRFQSPGRDTVVFQAGASYEAREYANRYNMVHLDLQDGHCTAHLRAYSDQDTGFWTEDLLSYEAAKEGRYTFALSEELVPVRPVGAEGTTMAEAVTRGSAIRFPSVQQVSVLERLPGWWQGHSFNGDPFAYASAVDVEPELLPRLFEDWYVDPRSEDDPRGPVLDEIEAMEYKPLGIIFADPGGGKTFYRRLMVQQLNEIAGGSRQRAVEIRNIRAGVTLEQVTGRDLACAIYRQVRDHAQVATALLSLDNEYASQVSSACDRVVGITLHHEQRLGHLYVFVDGIGGLFDWSNASQNQRSLDALCELCQAAAQRQGDRVVLRLFVPRQLRAPLVERIGDNRGFGECTIEWRASRCWDLIQRQLRRPYWVGRGDAVESLLSPDLRTEIQRWLERLERAGTLSPGCVVEAFHKLALHLCQGRCGSTEKLQTHHWDSFAKRFLRRSGLFPIPFLAACPSRKSRHSDRVPGGYLAF
jgi:predicted MPP superfamily phosphohydrolase